MDQLSHRLIARKALQHLLQRQHLLRRLKQKFQRRRVPSLSALLQLWKSPKQNRRLSWMSQTTSSLSSVFNALLAGEGVELWIISDFAVSANGAFVSIH